MPDDYISREAALMKLMQDGCSAKNLQSISDMPTADIAEVVHGEWETNSDRPDSLICSVCKCGFDMWKHDPHNYCPNCGARMDGWMEDADNGRF